MNAEHRKRGSGTQLQTLLSHGQSHLKKTQKNVHSWECSIQLPCAEIYILLLLAPFWVQNVGLFQKQTLPVLAELVERWGWVACWIGILNRHWQRRPGEQLLVLSQTATESFTGRDGLKRDLRTNIYFKIALKSKDIFQEGNCNGNYKILSNGAMFKLMPAAACHLPSSSFGSSWVTFTCRRSTRSPSVLTRTANAPAWTNSSPNTSSAYLPAQKEGIHDFKNVSHTGNKSTHKII